MELQFLEFLESIHSPMLDKFMIFITSLGNGGIIWIILALIIFFQKNKRDKREGLTLIFGLIIFSIIGLLILKPFIGRPRPYEVYDFNLLINKPMGSSFPSGHTGSSFATAWGIFHFNKKEGIFALILACLIGFSRMYLSVHYPTDVLAGIVVGILSSIGARTLVNKFV